MRRRGPTQSYRSLSPLARSTNALRAALHSCGPPPCHRRPGIRARQPRQGPAGPQQRQAPLIPESAASKRAPRSCHSPAAPAKRLGAGAPRRMEPPTGRRGCGRLDPSRAWRDRSHDASTGTARDARGSAPVLGGRTPSGCWLPAHPWVDPEVVDLGGAVLLALNLNRTSCQAGIGPDLMFQAFDSVQAVVSRGSGALVAHAVVGDGQRSSLRLPTTLRTIVRAVG